MYVCMLLFKAFFDDDAQGSRLEKEFHSIIPVIVPIFDGLSSMSSSIKVWLEDTYPGLLDDLEDTTSDHSKTSMRTEVKAMCQKFWFYGDDTKESTQDINNDSIVQSSRKRQEKISKENIDQMDDQRHQLNIYRRQKSQFYPNINIDRSLRASFSGEMFTGPLGGEYDDSDGPSLETDGLMGGKPGNNHADVITEKWTRDGLASIYDMKHIIFFYLVPIVKRMNHRKHNSHLWFFESICNGLRDKINYAFLTGIEMN